MKLGNTSQTQVTVPNFYLTKNVIEMEVFKTKNEMKKTFREKDLFRQTKDINLSNNFRNKQKMFEEYNKEKYIPIHKRGLNNKSLPQIEKKPQTSNKYVDDYDKFQNYLYKTDIINYTNPNLRENIRSNVNALIERINSNYDLEKWNRTESRQISNMIPKDTVSEITTYIQNNPSESDNFKNSLRDKLTTLSNFGSLKNKEHIMKTFTKFTDKYNGKQSNLTGLRTNSVMSKKNEMSDYEKMEPNPYTSVYERFRDTQIFNSTLSPTRTEFSKKIGEKYSYFRRKKVDENTIDTEKYDSMKHKGPFGENYTETLQKLRKFADEHDKKKFIDEEKKKLFDDEKKKLYDDE